ncbi:hypothetical protein ACJMK2_015827 [Sinanodonta woodiana]|uniref:Uncharacterized protein n=1 Tax=Sinanodonta woodiana TaxID=1069815 RepID=A0ABD3URN8_SINWO
MMCEGSSMLFDFQEKQCLLVYDEVSRLYNHTALQPESTFASVPPPNVYVTLTRFTHDRYVSLQQSTSGFDSDFFTSGGNSVGKQTFVPAFSQLIYASLIDGHVTQTNLVYERSVLFQQTSSVCVTNALYSNSETSVPVFYSYVALNVHMTQTQFVPEKYSLLQPVDGTVIFKPSTLSFAALKSTSEIYPIQLEPFASYIKINCTAVPDSTMETLIPVSNTLISLSSFFITASLSATTRIQNSYPSDPVQTLPNRMTKVLTSTTTITNLLERSSGKHHWLDKAVNTPLSDQIINYKSSDFLEMSVINYKTYLSVGCISTSEIISPSKYKRDSDVIENLTIQHLSTSYALSVKIDASSLDQHGYVPLNPSPTLDSSKTPFSTINSMAQLMLTIVASIQPTKANIASKSAPHTASMKSSEKPNVDANETTNMASSEANIFPSNMALSRSPSISPMSTTEDQMRSELILDSSFISSTSMKFSALLHKSETSVMGTYSLMRLFQSQHSTSFEYSPLQTTIFEVGGPSSRTALKIVPRPTPVTYDSQLSPSNILEISPSQSITCLATSIISNSSSSVKFSQTNVSSLISLTDSIPSSAPYMSNSQSAESTKSNRNDNITKTIISTKDQKLNPLNLSNTSFIAVLVGSCAGVLFIIMLTTILIIHLRKRTKRKRYLQSG